MSIEQIMVVPTEVFKKCGEFQGFSESVGKYIPTLLWSAMYKPRPEMEIDENFKQLIPYCVIRHGGFIFNYSRAKTQGEARLHGKRSIGVGGHISTVDRGVCGDSYRAGMLRELEEEIKLNNLLHSEKCIGLLNDDSNEVGRVHLGVVHIIDVDGLDILTPEASMMDPVWTKFEDLEGQIEQFETWSQILLRTAPIAYPK